MTPVVAVPRISGSDEAIKHIFTNLSYPNSDGINSKMSVVKPISTTTILLEIFL